MKKATLKKVALAIGAERFPIHLLYGVWSRGVATVDVRMVNSKDDYMTALRDYGVPDAVIVGGELIQD